MSREQELLNQAIEQLKAILDSKSYIERVKIDNNEDTNYEGKTITISVDYEPKQQVNVIGADFDFEKGNVATPWTPAPEDIIELSNLMETEKKTINN
ncbi:hypothetical protein FEZ48_06240 [Marinilactibacillus psychrotolerans]|uniref:Uncharacterized protein n=1 Tax=Marinilactibacillus psychrotolerans TaxID=191770 RepID=A0A5R9C411_9LACT|nr:hypothetical protein [Marinilactibacillus psychrotolerans]TLQ07578.1 hypothetical protein FEZ48_06240 [Marinilactibacillus psychrotolerans]